MKIKYFSLLAIFIAGTVWGQSTEKTEKQDRYRVVTNSFWSNWFISAGGGAQIYFGDNDKQMKFTERLSPALDIAVGKWFTPGIGVRLVYSGLSMKGAVQNGSHSTGEVYDASQGLYKQKFNFMNIHGDMLFNLSNLLCGYNEKRFYSFIAYGGFGWMDTWQRPRKHDVSANVGIMNSFRLSSRLDLNLDARGSMVNDDFDGELGGRGFEGPMAVTLGLTYKLGHHRTWLRSASGATSPIGEDQMEQIRKQLRDMGAENDSLRHRLANAKTQPVNEKEVVKEVTRYSAIAAPYLVTFGFGKNTLSKEIRVNLGFLAKVIKQSPENAVYTITGYADKGTGSSEFNERLSFKRAQAVRDCLVNEHGVEPERLKVAASGGVENMFYNDPNLSRAVITQVTTEK